MRGFLGSEYERFLFRLLYRFFEVSDLLLFDLFFELSDSESEDEEELDDYVGVKERETDCFSYLLPISKLSFLFNILALSYNANS